MHDCDVGADAATGREGSDEFHPPRLQCGNEMVEDGVRHVFIKDARVAKALQVHLQALEFHALFVWRIRERKRAEIGLPCFGANRSELGAYDFDYIIPLRELVVERFEKRSGIFGHDAYKTLLAGLVERTRKAQRVLRKSEWASRSTLDPLYELHKDPAQIHRRGKQHQAEQEREARVGQLHLQFGIDGATADPFCG